MQRIGPSEWLLDIRVFKAGSKEIRKRINFTGSKDQAKAQFLKVKKQLRDGSTFNSSLTQTQVQSFKDILRIYRENPLKGPYSPCQLAKVDQLERLVGEYPLKDFGSRFKSFIDDYRRNPSTLTKKKRKPHAANRFIEIARAAFTRWINLLREDLEERHGEVDESSLPRNPISKTRFPKQEETPRDIDLDDLQKQRLLNRIAQDAPHLSAIVSYALEVPARKSELVNMKREDLDLFNNVIRVRCGTTKNDQGQWKPIPPSMVEYFRTLPADTEYLFFRRDREGKAVPLGDFKRAWKRCLRLEKLSAFTFHSTRHVSATAMIDRGTPEQVVMTIANWKTNMLSTYYNRKPKRTFNQVAWGNPGNLQKNGLETDSKIAEMV